MKFAKLLRRRSGNKRKKRKETNCMVFFFYPELKSELALLCASSLFQSSSITKRNITQRPKVLLLKKHTHKKLLK